MAASLETFSTTAPRPSRADAARAPSTALVSRNGPSRFVARAQFQVLAVGVAQQLQRRRPEVRGVVDQHVEAAEFADDLHGDGVDVVLHGDVADDAVRAGVLARHLLDAARRAGDEGHPRAAAEQLAGRGPAQARRCRP